MLSRLVWMLVTKLRSILMMSNGSERRCDSDEKPVPKSSSARRMPWFLRLVTIVRASSMSANSELSVISITSRSPGSRSRPEFVTIRCASQPSASCEGEILTEILISGSHVYRFAQGFTDHLLGQAADQANLLGDRNEDVRTDDSGQRMNPARQHLEPDDLAGREIDLRLEIGNELAVLEAEADPLLDLAIGNQRALHARVEPHRAADASVSRMVHGDIGAAQQVGDSGVGRRRGSDSGEAADLDDPLLEQERAGCRFEAWLRRLLGAVARRSSVSAAANSSPLSLARMAFVPSLRPSPRRCISIAGRRSHNRAGR